MSMEILDTDGNHGNRSDIQTFYAKSTIFITGGTGFLGNVLLEKLLRSCPDIKTIYLLTREKKGKDPRDRFKELFDDAPIFERMKVECPNYLCKVVPITGDCIKPNLGISEHDLNTMINEVDIIFHLAATVNFDSPLRNSVNINIRATRDLLDIAHSMKQLKAFIHISTAYSNVAEHKIVEEKFYQPSIQSDNLIKVVEALPDKILTRITMDLIRPWPNTYTFTKAIAEDVVRSKGKGIPMSIVRPAIVIATAKEPIPGWINNFYGPSGVTAAAGLGLLRTINVDGNCIAELVPCDFTVNSIIASAWDVSNTWRKRKALMESKREKLEDCAEIPILNYISSSVKPITWNEFMEFNQAAEPEIALSLAIWVYCLTLNKYKFVHQVSQVFLHLLPALVVDTYARLTGREPRLWKAYEKIHKFSEVISYFSTKQWKFVDSNTRSLCEKLSPRDRELFNFDLSASDWQEYFYHYTRGVRVYLMRDNMDTVEKAIAKRKKLLIAHYTLKTLVYCLLLLLMFQFIKFIFNLRMVINCISQQ